MPAQVKDAEITLAEFDQPLLTPIEKPRGLLLKLIYAMSRRQFGKVMTPLKVFMARMPLGFGQFFGNDGDNPFAQLFRNMPQAPQGEGPDQNMAKSRGNEYLTGQFPRLDYIKTATIEPAQ